MPDQSAFKLLAGHVALDFANTLDNRFDAARTEELLASYADFARFAQQSGVIDAAQASSLGALTDREKQSALRSARELREVIERIFSAAACGDNFHPEDLDMLNKYLEKALHHRRLSEVDGRIRWSWSDLGEAAAAPLWPITLSAADLLTSADLLHVRECGADTCRWLFLDLSKNHTRRWCDMKICGNRTKARRYYQTHN